LEALSASPLRNRQVLLEMNPHNLDIRSRTNTVNLDIMRSQYQDIEKPRG
jgi:hypothetical protein